MVNFAKFTKGLLIIKTGLPAGNRMWNNFKLITIKVLILISHGLDRIYQCISHISGLPRSPTLQMATRPQRGVPVSSPITYLKHVCDILYYLHCTRNIRTVDITFLCTILYKAVILILSGVCERDLSIIYSWYYHTARWERMVMFVINGDYKMPATISVYNYLQPSFIYTNFLSVSSERTNTTQITIIWIWWLPMNILIWSVYFNASILNTKVCHMVTTLTRYLINKLLKLYPIIPTS